MAISINIRERDILKFILDELNTNVFSSKIKFTLGDSARVDDTSMLIRRFTLDDNTERMDLVETFDESTYMTEKNPYIIVNVSNLNPEFTALNTIKEVTYSGDIGFLICEENPNVYRATLHALEEIRSRLIQYHKVIRVQYLDYDNPSSTTQISEDIKLITTTGGLQREFIDRINGKSYLYFTLPITIMATNHGEFANQETISIGVNSITETVGEVTQVKMFPIEPIEWGWGMGIDTEGTQLLNDISVSNLAKSERVRHVPKSKAYAWSCVLQIDFRNALLKKIFKDSRNVNTSSATEIWYIKSEIKTYNATTQVYEVDSSLTYTSVMYLTTNRPLESVSKGEKYIFYLEYEPKLDEVS
jgi:hypothetical protein